MDEDRSNETRAPKHPVMAHELYCDTAEELIEELLPTRSSWLREERGIRGRRRWLFRGQADAAWGLQPKSFRTTQHKHGGELYSIAEIRRLVPGQVIDTLPGPANLARQELAWVIEFCQQLHEIGLPIPDNSPELRNLDLNKIDLHTFPPTVYRAAFALAQHYGLPTRLLDWTTRPLVAAYFAALDVARERCEQSPTAPQKEQLAIWALNWDFLPFYSSCDPGFEFVSVPSSSNPNLLAQSGLFTLVRFGPNNPKALVEHPPSLDKIVRDTPRTDLPAALQDELPALVKVVLPCREARALLRLLADYNVSAAQVFPGYKGAADALYERRWWQWGLPGSRS